MQTIVLIIHLILVVSLILVILVQKTSSDGLQGLSGGANSGNALFSVRGKANMFSRITAFLAIGFFCTSLALAYMAAHKSGHSIVDQLSVSKSLQPERVLPVFAKKDQAGTPAQVAPAKPLSPEVPLAK